MAAAAAFTFLSSFLSMFALLSYLASAADPASKILAYSSEDLLSEIRLVGLFDTWNGIHGKQYAAADVVEKHHRFEIFKSNLQHIDAHNRKKATYRLGLTRFADLTNEEFRERFLGLKGAAAQNRPRIESRRAVEIAATSSLPAELDWRKEGAVTSIKDQGSCGSCWAFSAAGAIEGVNAIATGNLVSVSEQEIVSCDLGGDSLGCYGGLMDDAFEWVINNGGVATEDSYPYTSSYGATGVCNKKLQAEKTITIDGYVDVPANSDEALLNAVKQQPVSVAIDGSALDFQLYYEGVFTGDCSDDPYDTDHAVLVVGWGSESGLNYWIVKNSWGAYWGMGGYIHMVRTENPFGICAINTMPSYPTKASYPSENILRGAGVLMAES